jgi:ferredoxin, 2Fe-2S
VDAEATITVEPLGVVLRAAPGETVMAAAQRCGYRWPTICGGDGSCTICWVDVIAGADALGPLTEHEQRWLRASPVRRLARGDPRLACQAVVTGSVVVKKKGVRVVGT